MITHLWAMTFTDEATPAQRAAFVEAMAALPTQIDDVASFRSGTDLGLNPGNHDVAIVAEFADAASWRAYIDDPTHVAFVEAHVTPVCASWGAIQFES